MRHTLLLVTSGDSHNSDATVGPLSAATVICRSRTSRIDTVLVAPVDHHRYASLREPSDDRQANAAGRTGDDRRLSVELDLHVTSADGIGAPEPP